MVLLIATTRSKSLEVKKVTIPGSKSITNRAIILAALSKDSSVIKLPLISDDTEYMMTCLRKIGYKIEQTDQQINITKDPHFKLQKETYEFFIGNAGTTIRFLTTFLANFGSGTFIVKGEKRMHERPIKDLVDPLKKVGAEIEYLETSGYPPLKIKGKKLNFDKITIDGSKSSQYVSSILMNLNNINSQAKLIVKNPVSKPYIETTISTLKEFGVTIKHNNYEEFFVEKGSYSSTEFNVPADASSASYFFGAAFLLNQPTVFNIGSNCLQGDIAFLDILTQLGGQFEINTNEIKFIKREKTFQGIEVDMNAIPDTVQTLAVMAIFATSPTIITNVYNLRIKETDRLYALETELNKLGAKVITGKDYIKIVPLPNFKYKSATIETYEDHRMAMSFALASLFINNIDFEDKMVVTKSFKNFWDVWEHYLK